MRKYLISGLLIWIPIWVTFVVIRFIIDLLDQSLALLPHRYQPDNLFGFHIPGLGLLFTLLIVFLTGLFAANFIGSGLVHLWERILAKIPLIRSVYSAVKQMLNAFVQPKSTSFRKVVMVQFPRENSWSIGFQTSERVNNLPSQKESIAVFIPTCPNPTAGFLLYVSTDQVTELNLTVEEAFKLIISVGVITPSRTDLVKR
ncbi:MAG: hypothetical protein A3F10_04180 [Coxiella sp. RIFCSPHIGHO2_12_FULL_42_15]|nr:MAG: hypothetical protein A3F10_04180 [Coxiella sp. RIFCSPHIGHO2_12_FULL_42_15]